MPWVPAPSDAGRLHVCGLSVCMYAPLYIDIVCMFTQWMLVHITSQCRSPDKIEREKRGSVAMTSPPPQQQQHMTGTTGPAPLSCKPPSLISPSRGRRWRRLEPLSYPTKHADSAGTGVLAIGVVVP